MVIAPAAAVRTVAVVPAAGRGVRLGVGTPKAFVEVGGTSLLRRCVDGLLVSGVVDLVVVVVPMQLLAVARQLVPAGVVAVAGGVYRSDSVRAGLDVLHRLAPQAQFVLVHDAARAFTPAGLVVSVVQELLSGAVAVVPVLAVTDTIKCVDASGVITSTPDREGLRAAQTPQGFTVAVLDAAYTGELDATDDAGLVERAGVPVHTVPGHPMAFKITTPTDLAMAQALLARAR